MKSKTAWRASALVGQERRSTSSLFEGLEEGFADGVVVGAAAVSHRELDPGLAAAPAERERDVLRALVGVMDESWLGSAAVDGHLEGVDDELGAEVVGDRPADDPARVAVEHDRDVEPALPGAHVADVGDPEPVRRRRG